MKENFEKSYLERIAKVAHEMNRTWCESINDGMKNVPWEETTEQYQNGIMEGVAFVLSTPNIKESDSHENWLSAKKADGWVWGPAKDESKKEHPCMLPYSELPAEQKAKDKIFIATVLSMRSIPLKNKIEDQEETGTPGAPAATGTEGTPSTTTDASPEPAATGTPTAPDTPYTTTDAPKTQTPSSKKAASPQTKKSS